MVPPRPHDSAQTATAAAEGCIPSRVAAVAVARSAGRRGESAVETVWIARDGVLTRHDLTADGAVSQEPEVVTELPCGVAAAGIAATARDVFIVDDATGSVHRFDGEGRCWSCLSGSGASGSRVTAIGGSVQVPPATAIAVCPDERRLLIATRAHQIWQVDLRSGAGKPLVGTGERGLGDGVAAAAMLAGPAAMCISTDGRRLYVAEYESSAVREIDLGTHYTATIVGRGVGEHGRVDGDFPDARLNRPLGIAAVITPEGERLLVADSGNGLVRFVDPKARTVATAASFSEPRAGRITGVAAVGRAYDGTMLIIRDGAVMRVKQDGHIAELARGYQPVTTIEARDGEPLELTVGLAGLALARRSMLRLSVSSLPNGSLARTLAQRVVDAQERTEVRISIPASSVHDDARWVVECESLCEETVEISVARHQRWLVAVRTSGSAPATLARIGDAG